MCGCRPYTLTWRIPTTHWQTSCQWHPLLRSVRLATHWQIKTASSTAAAMNLQSHTRSGTKPPLRSGSRHRQYHATRGDLADRGNHPQPAVSGRRRFLRQRAHTEPGRRRSVLSSDAQFGRFGAGRRHRRSLGGTAAGCSGAREPGRNGFRPQNVPGNGRPRIFVFPAGGRLSGRFPWPPSTPGGCSPAGGRRATVTATSAMRRLTSAAIEQINAARPDVLLVGMGNPIQEQWIAAYLPQLRVSACLGIGGLFDYWAGNVSRAPAWLRRLGHEWVWRLLQEPRLKARRYLLGNPLFLARVLKGREAVSARHPGQPAVAPEVETRAVASFPVILIFPSQLAPSRM